MPAAGEAPAPTGPDLVGVDTSVAVALVLRDHAAHAAVTRWARGRTLALAGPALLETYAVLTRLPAPSRVSAADAATLLRTRFAPPLAAPGADAVVERLARAGVAGGATYDAVVALAAAARGVPLASRDRRAHATYAAVGATVLVVT